MKRNLINTHKDRWERGFQRDHRRLINVAAARGVVQSIDNRD
jgi:hypothetical protein